MDIMELKTETTSVNMSDSCHHQFSEKVREYAKMLRHQGNEQKKVVRRRVKQEMERKRRARINDTLTALRDAVVSYNNKNPDDFMKLEKADILEMTLEFIQSHVTSTSSSTGSPSPPHMQHPSSSSPTLRPHSDSPESDSSQWCSAAAAAAAQVQECAAEVQHILQMAPIADPVQRDLLSARLNTVRARLSDTTNNNSSTSSSSMLSIPTQSQEMSAHSPPSSMKLLPYNGLAGGHITALTFGSPPKVWRPF